MMRKESGINKVNRNVHINNDMNFAWKFSPNCKNSV